MSRSLDLKTKAFREARADASVAASGAECMENIPVRSNETVDQNAKAIEMFIDDMADDDSESDARTMSPSTQHHGEFEKKPGIHTQRPLQRTKQKANGRRESLGNVLSSIEDNTDTIVFTMEWRRAVLQSLEESRVELDAEIKGIRQHYHEQKKVLETEFAKLWRIYEQTITELEREGQDEEDYFVDGCDAQSDYQPTECGEGSGSVTVMPERGAEIECKGL